MTIFTAMQAEIREVNVANGWYEDAERPFGDDIALLHSEVSEMYEAYRQWGTADVTEQGPSEMRVDPDGTTRFDAPKKPEGVGSEAADVLIRLLDTCDRHDIDLSAEYDRKLAHNRTRGYRHGGKAV